MYDSALSLVLSMFFEQGKPRFTGCMRIPAGYFLSQYYSGKAPVRQRKQNICSTIRLHKNWLYAMINNKDKISSITKGDRGRDFFRKRAIG